MARRNPPPAEWQSIPIHHPSHTAPGSGAATTPRQVPNVPLRRFRPRRTLSEAKRPGPAPPSAPWKTPERPPRVVSSDPDEDAASGTEGVRSLPYTCPARHERCSRCGSTSLTAYSPVFGTVQVEVGQIRHGEPLQSLAEAAGRSAMLVKGTTSLERGPARPGASPLSHRPRGKGTPGNPPPRECHGPTTTARSRQSPSNPALQVSAVSGFTASSMKSQASPVHAPTSMVRMASGYILRRTQIHSLQNPIRTHART